jgi:WhiB family redox-sensing transcriptional regulator
MAETRRAAPTVDLRNHDDGVSTYLADEFPNVLPAWDWCVGYTRRLIEMSFPASREVSGDTIKGFDRSCGADRNQLDRAIAALDAGSAVAFYGWWPTPETLNHAPILGVELMEVPTPDRKGATLVDGHAVVLVGYARHRAFPGGGYFVVRDPNAPGRFTGLPFTYVRAYATTLWTGRPELRDSADRPEDGDQLDPVDANRRIASAARCADPRASYTSLFFSEDPRDVLRAKAICSVCTVRQLCLSRALERREPYGVWGGEFLFDGAVVAVKRGRGRPRATPLPLYVDEVTGQPLETVA